MNIIWASTWLGEYMVERGSGFLGWNIRFRGNEAFFQLDHALTDIGVGERWLKEEARNLKKDQETAKKVL